MKPILQLLAAALLIVPLASLVASGAGAEKSGHQTGEWQALFNGKDLTGWRQYGKKAPPGPGWKVEDGILKKVAGQRGGDIITEQTFNDFELTWDWRIAPGGNNGIKYLVSEKRQNGPGHEYQMIDDANNSDGKLGPKHQTASFYDVLPPWPVTKKLLTPAGEWNTSRVIIRGNHVEHWLNGEKVLEYELGSDQVKEGVAKSKFKSARGFGEKIKGHIMLTDHHDECWFRNIKIRSLD